MRTVLLALCLLLCADLADARSLPPDGVHGWIGGWVGDQTSVRGLVFGRNMPDDLALVLVRQGGGGRRPVTISLNSTPETLRVSADLSGLEDGVFDLEYSRRGGPPQTVPAVLMLGEPPVLRVPEEYPTIASALAAAKPGSEIRIAHGSYRESVTVDKPVRLMGDPGPWIPLLWPGETGERIVHVQPEAGSLFEAHRLWIHAVDAAAGIRMDAPGLVQDCSIQLCRAAGPGARGAGLDAPNGGRVIGCEFAANKIVAEGAPIALDPWSTDPDKVGAGSNLFGLGVRVERCTFAPGTAPQGSCLVVDGIFAGNAVASSRSSDEDTAFGAVVRGRIERNSFESDCWPTRLLLVDGPSLFARNTVCHFIFDLCDNEPGSFTFRGSVIAEGNLSWGVAGHVCLDVDPTVEPYGGSLSMFDNVVDFVDHDVVLDWDGDPALCSFDAPPGFRVRMSRSDVAVGCNRSNSGGFSWREGGVATPCDSCSFNPYLGIPPGCPASSMTEGLRCRETTPVLVLDHGVETHGTGVRLWWRVNAEVTPPGYEIWRETIGGFDDAPERLTSDPLTGCWTCEFLDIAPPREAESVRYRLDVLVGDGSRESLTLGEWTPTPLPWGVTWLDPRPYPLRSNGWLRFELRRDEATVALEAYDLSGRRILARDLGARAAGRHEVRWASIAGEGRTPAGVYLFRVVTPTGTALRKLLLLP